MGPLKSVIAYFSPGWPQEHFANGIISQVSAMKRALEAHNVRVFVLTHNIKGEYADKDIVNLFHFSPKQRIIDNLTRMTERVLSGPYERMARRAAQDILKGVRHLYTNEGLQLLEMEESFGTAYYVALRSPVPVVVHLHGPWFVNGMALGVPYDREFKKRVNSEIKGICAAAGVIATSQDVLDRTRSYYKNAELPMFEVIPSPINAVPEGLQWSFSASEKEHILFVGRFDRHKGADVAIGAFARLAQSRPECQMTFVGPDRGLIDDAGRQWGCEEYINAHVFDSSVRRRFRWLGELGSRDIEKLRCKASVTIVPSRYENFASTVLEAMAFGCPLVAARTGGITEIIEDGVTGLLAEPGDSMDLAKKIDLLLSDHELAISLGKRAVDTCIKRYDAKLIAEQTLRFYRRVIDKHKDYNR